MSFDKAAEMALMKQKETAIPPAPKGGRMAWALKPGYAWNPLLKYPRNDECPCGSGTKFKNCHLNKMPRAIPVAAAADYVKALRMDVPLKFIEDDSKDLVTHEENSEG